MNDEFDFTDYDVTKDPSGAFAAAEQKFSEPPIHDPIMLKAYNEAKHQFFKTLFLRQFVTDFMDNGIVPLDGEPIGKYKTLIDKQFLKNSVKSPFIFLTVNPRPGVTFDQVDKAVKKFVGKKTVTHWAYVYEVRAREEDYTGLHCHILLEYTTKPYDFKRSTKSTFSKICDISNPHVLNFKFIDAELLPQKFQYMLGDKTETKLAGVNLTNEWRELRGIEQIYESIPPLPCRDTQNPLITEIEDDDNKEDK